jgi:hypothetical protein
MWVGERGRMGGIEGGGGRGVHWRERRRMRGVRRGIGIRTVGIWRWWRWKKGGVRVQRRRRCRGSRFWRIRPSSLHSSSIVPAAISNAGSTAPTVATFAAGGAVMRVITSLRRRIFGVGVPPLLVVVSISPTRSVTIPLSVSLVFSLSLSGAVRIAFGVSDVAVG